MITEGGLKNTISFQSVTPLDPLSLQEATALSQSRSINLESASSQLAPPLQIESLPSRSEPISSREQIEERDEEEKENEGTSKISAQPEIKFTHVNVDVVESPEQYAKRMTKLSEKADKLLEDIQKRKELYGSNPQKLTILEKIPLENTKLSELHAELLEDGTLFIEMKERDKEIHERLELLRPAIEQHQKNPVDKESEQLFSKIKQIEDSSLRRVKGGQGGAYFGPGVVVKPKGEGVGEIHNGKGYSFVTKTDDTRVRKSIPLYQEPEREAATYQVAITLGIGKCTPPTIIAILHHDDFGHFSYRLEGDEKKRVEASTQPVKEKVCTIQKLIPDSTLVQDINILFKEWLMEKKGINFEEISKEDRLTYLSEYCQNIKFEDFEQCNILQWISGENDGNFGNFLLTKNPDGSLSLSKIDNGLAFPERNEEFDNQLVKLPLGDRVVSSDARQKILDADPKMIGEILKANHLEATIPAMEKRVKVLKRLVLEFPEISHREMNLRLSLLQISEEACFQTLSEAQLKKLKGATPAMHHKQDLGFV